MVRLQWTMKMQNHLPRESERLVGILGGKETEDVLLYCLLEVGLEDYVLPAGFLDLSPKASVLHPALIIDPYVIMELICPNTDG